ncbi:unnamed protein product [Didymodactylos carnosus]|uniref:Uncharacterized protein n=1 Tax=Didymodactylos carnosus TaxID=1234261 RepID=A0A813R2C6_9BILA|nr:unnamed protein product [Didymodactylos carnosus]CAF3557503.1 unnamed protein product [Didymodactylos carnosus]
MEKRIKRGKKVDGFCIQMSRCVCNSTSLNPFIQSVNGINNKMLTSVSPVAMVSSIKLENRQSIDNNNRSSYSSEVITTNNSTDIQTTKLLSNITTYATNNNNISHDSCLPSISKNNLSNETIDHPSRLNQFSWEELDGRYIPVLFRNENGQQERYTSKIYVENTLFQNESWQKHAILAKSLPLVPFTYTESELKLFRSIIEWHLAQFHFKSIPSTDCLIRYNDLIDFYSTIRTLRDLMPSTTTFNHHKQNRPVPFEISTVNHTLHQQIPSNLTLNTHIPFISQNSKFVDSSTNPTSSPQSTVVELLHRQQKQMKTYPASPPNLLNSEVSQFPLGYLPSNLLMPPNSYPFHFSSPRTTSRQPSLIAPKPQTNGKSTQDLSTNSKTHNLPKQPSTQLQWHSQQSLQYQQHLLKQQSPLKNNVNKPPTAVIPHQYETPEKPPYIPDAKKSGWVQINNVFVPYIVKLKLRDGEIDNRLTKQQLQREIYVPYEILIKCQILSNEEFLFKKFLIRATLSDFEIFNQLISNINIFDEKIPEKTLLVNLYHIMIGLNRVLYVKMLSSKQPRAQVNKFHQDVLKQRGGTLRINDKLVPYLIQNNRYYVPLLYTYSSIINGVNFAKKFARAPRQFEIDYLNLLFLYFSIDNIVLTPDTLLVDAYDVKIPNIQIIKHLSLIEHQQRERMSLNNIQMKLSTKKVHKNLTSNTSTMNSAINQHSINTNISSSCKQSKCGRTNVVVNPLIHTATFYGLSTTSPSQTLTVPKSTSVINTNKSNIKITTSLAPQSCSLSNNLVTSNPALATVQNTVVLNPALNSLLHSYTKQHHIDIHTNSKLTKTSNPSDYKQNNSVKNSTNSHHYHHYSHKTSDNGGVIINSSLEKSIEKSSITPHFNHYPTSSPPLIPQWAPDLNSLASYVSSSTDKKKLNSNMFQPHQLALTKDIQRQNSQHSYQEQQSKSSRVTAPPPPPSPLYPRPEIRSFQIRRRPFYGIVKSPETPIGDWKIPSSHILNQFASTITINTFLKLCDNEFDIKLVLLDNDEKSLVSHHVGLCSPDECFIYHRDLERCIELLLSYKRILQSLSTTNYALPSFPSHSPEIPVQNEQCVNTPSLPLHLMPETTVTQSQKTQPAARKRKATVPATRIPSNTLDEKCQQQQQMTVVNSNSISSPINSDRSSTPQPPVEISESMILSSVISPDEEPYHQLNIETVEKSPPVIATDTADDNEPNLLLLTPTFDSTGVSNSFDAVSSSSPLKSISTINHPDDEGPSQFIIEVIPKNHTSDTIPSCSSGYESSGFGGSNTAQSTDEQSPLTTVTISHLDEPPINNKTNEDDTDGDSCRSRTQSYVSTELSFKEQEDDELLLTVKEDQNQQDRRSHSPLLQSTTDRRRLGKLSCLSPPTKRRCSSWGEPVEICSTKIEKSLRTLNVNGGGKISINEVNEQQRNIHSSSKKRRRRGRLSLSKKSHTQSSISKVIIKPIVPIPTLSSCSEDIDDHDECDRSNDIKTTDLSKSLDLCTDSDTSELDNEIFTNVKCRKRSRKRRKVSKTISHENDDSKLDRIVVQVDNDDDDYNHQTQSNSSDSNLFKMFDNTANMAIEQQNKTKSLITRKVNDNSAVVPSQQDIPAMSCTYKIQCNPDRLSLTLKRIQK